MQIKLVEIGNFRKLQKVRVDLAEKTTVFVGANNSGKTSAMVALRHFLVGRTDFSINDFTLSNWAKLDALGQQWEAQKAEEAEQPFDWNTVLPHLDVWLDVPEGELHHVQKILPTLDWAGALIGVRLRYEPKEYRSFKAEYLNAKLSAEAVISANTAAEAPSKARSQGADGFALWPRSLMDFLSVKLRSMFEVRAYLLDPAKLVLPKGGIAAPQAIPPDSEPVEGDPLKKIIRIDEISAQRGFGFAPTTIRGDDGYEESATRGGKKLSSQLRHYYTQHLDPFDQPEPKDLEALQALHGAQAAFGKRLEVCFADALRELEEIGYPGVADPKLTITTNIKPVDGLNHASAVQYVVPTHQSAGAGQIHHLPEDSNGLGYQNLVSIIFALMSFRDKWMRVGKAGKKTGDDAEELIPPLHLVLIEEPEAHLHAQVQQVFIRQAYEVLRKHDRLKTSKDLCTQLVVSTHSSHLAHEAEFTSLRYFRRLPVKAEDGSVPVSCVVNLSETFGTEDDTARFVKRYLKATHCDLFFADGAILVEGPAERILVPHFVRSKGEYEFLRRCYVTWVEIGGSHAHRLKSLIEHIGLNTLIITDIDAKNAGGNSVPPARGASLKARNETLKSWVPKSESLDALLDTNEADLALWDNSGYGVRVAYQQPIMAKFKSADSVELLANTFEDALVYENLETFKNMDGTGLLGRFRKSIDDAANAVDLAEKFAADLGKGGKAEFAMELLYSEEIDTMEVPAYIGKGLLWLAAQLKRKEDDVLGKEPSAVSMLEKNAPKGPVTDSVIA